MENSEMKTFPNEEVTVLFEKEDLSLSVAENSLAVATAVESTLQQGVIHFYFCLTGNAVFSFGPHYSREITQHKNYFFYNPEKTVNFQLQVAPHTKMVFMTISLESLHRLFIHDTLPLLKPENINRKFYEEREIPSYLLVVLNQLFTASLSESAAKLYFQGKTYELLSLYFSYKEPSTENCPFLKDQETVRKIKHAKEHLLKYVDSPPSLKELAKIAGLNEHQLKAGFKEIYGNSVFSFLLEHKLDHARVLLDTMKYQVNEVAFQTGYANPSHFIAAFKKKFGVTPKKYLMSKT